MKRSIERLLFILFVLIVLVTSALTMSDPLISSSVWRTTRALSLLQRQNRL